MMSRELRILVGWLVGCAGGGRLALYYALVPTQTLRGVLLDWRKFCTDKYAHITRPRGSVRFGRSVGRRWVFVPKVRRSIIAQTPMGGHGF